MGMGLSRYGRVTTPYPLWDGTNRVLVAFRPCEVTRNGVVVSCATLTAAEKARLGEEQPHRGQAAADELQDNVPAVYAIYMFDPANADLADRGCAAARLHVHRPGRDAARAPSRTRPQPTSVDAALAGPEPRR